MQGSYRGYSLKGIPSQARPTSNSLGAHSYTVKRGDARIEVSMDQKDFCCVFLIRFMVRKEMIPTMIDRRDETITENN
jgi:hypothetical protein